MKTRADVSVIDVRITALSLGLFGAAAFASCVVYGLLVPPGFHAAALLEQVLPGFRWLTPASVALGLVGTFVYGVYAGALYAFIHNALLCLGSGPASAVRPHRGV